MLQFNIAPNTQLGLIDIPDEVYTNENSANADKYSRSGEFIENLVCDNLIEFCKRWLHLAGFNEFMQDWDEFNRQFRKTCTRSGNYGIFIYDNEQLKIAPLVDKALDNCLEQNTGIIKPFISFAGHTRKDAT